MSEASAPGAFMSGASILERAVGLSIDGAISANGVQLQPMAPRDRLHLAVARPSLGALDRLEARLGLELPRTPSWIQTDTIAVFALGPRTWLVESESLASVRARLGSDLRADGINAADASDTLQAFRLTGERAGDLLATGCAVDLHPDAFPEHGPQKRPRPCDQKRLQAPELEPLLSGPVDSIGRERAPANGCVRTLLARVDVILSAAGSGFEVRVDRSLARYLWSWFANAAVEFGA